MRHSDRQFKISFHDALGFLLPHRRRTNDLTHRLKYKASIKNVIESLGVPHTEIGQILVNGQAVDFAFTPQNGCRVAVLPAQPPMDVTRPSLLRPKAHDRLRFVVDLNVGKLAALLRLIGLDAAYSPQLTDGQIADIAVREQRTVLSKDVELLKYRRVTFGHLVRAVHPDEQLREIVEFFGISGPYKLFSRCLRCNAVLRPVAKNQILNRLEPKTKKYYHRFKLCPDCRRIYWQGSHHERMTERLKRVGIEVSNHPHRPMEGDPQN